jgi:hypothetical protein
MYFNYFWTLQDPVKSFNKHFPNFINSCYIKVALYMYKALISMRFEQGVYNKPS